MISQPDCTRTNPWTPRVVVQLAVLATAAFVYVTAEIVPVGALSAMSESLGVREAAVGGLLAWYALVAAVTTIPLVRATAHWPRRRALLLALGALTVSQVVSALAPTFGMLVVGRVLCALTHGLLWAVIAPIATRLVPASYSGRATTAIYVGSSLGLVLGVPIMARLSMSWGWRPAVGCVAIAAAVVLVAARLVLPPMRLDPGQQTQVGEAAHHLRNPRLVAVCLLTLVLVAGHFISYTFILKVIQDVVGLTEPRSVAWLLAGYGVVGVFAMALIARPLDRRPAAVMIVSMTVLCVAFTVLVVLAVGGGGRAALAVPVGTAAILLWGATAATVAPMLQSTVMRTAPADPDGASGLYVTAFQIGIMAGALLGGVLYDRAGPALVLTASTVLFVVAVTALSAGRRLLQVAAIVEPT